MIRLDRHIASFAAAALVATTPARSFQSRPDTARVYRYDEIVVSAERYPRSAEEAGAVQYPVERVASWEFGGPGASLAAQRNLHLAPYGGGMALQTLSIRGMGAEHTLFLWNGLPAANMQSGVVDLNLFSAADLREISVVPGGASAIYGASAVGGVVNLVPVSPLDSPPTIGAGGKAGSFGEAGAFVRATMRPDGETGVSLRAATVSGRGNYPFTDPATGTGAVRSGADFRSTSLALSGGADCGDRERIGIAVSGLSLEQGAPGPWTNAAAPEPTGRREDRRLIASLSYDRPGVTVPPVTAGAMLDIQYERYRDPSLEADNHYRTTWAGGAAQFRRNAGEWLLLQATADLRYERAAGNAIDSTRTRTGGALAASASGSFRPWSGAECVITPSLRAEAVSTFLPAYNPRIGINITMETGEASVRFHGAVAGATRNPTMNELWYTGEGGAGNPGLRSESALSLEGGFGGVVRLWGKWSADLTWYRIDMTDRIVWMPSRNPRVWTPGNIGQTRSTGVEAALRWAVLPGELEIDVDYATIDSRRGELNADGVIVYKNQLAYIPLDKGSAGFLVGRSDIAPWLDRLGFTFRFVYTGVRYTTEDQTASLPAVSVGEAGCEVRFKASGGLLTLRYDAGNLAGIDYQMMPGYPMPRFHHSLSIYWIMGT